MTHERVATVLGRRSGLDLSRDLLVSLASAFACDPDRACWRAFQELVAANRPGMPTDLMASRMNSCAQPHAGVSCWWPASLSLTAARCPGPGRCFFRRATVLESFPGDGRRSHPGDESHSTRNRGGELTPDPEAARCHSRTLRLLTCPGPLRGLSGDYYPRQESFASLHILTRRASEGSEALPSLARWVRMSFFGARVIRSPINPGRVRGR